MPSREALEDLTGGVTSELLIADIFDRNEFWTNQLMKVNIQFLFGMTQMGGRHGERKGIVEKHAYSIIQATELTEGSKVFRLLKIRYVFFDHGMILVAYVPCTMALMKKKVIATNRW